MMSTDMTMMSAKMNLTGVNLKKTKGHQSPQDTEIEDLGRLDTQEDEFDILAIQKHHTSN